jgi:carboxypeptidase T
MQGDRLSPRKWVALMGAAFVLLAVTLTGGSGARAGVPPKAQEVRPDAWVLRVHFSSLEERDRLARELPIEEAPTAGGYLTVIADRDLYNSIVARGLRVSVDEAATRELNTTIVWGHNTDTFYGGYRTVEEIGAFMDEKVAAYPTLVEKVDIGDSWCKTHPGQCPNPAPGFAGYDIEVLHITNRAISGPKPVFWFNSGLHAREIVPPELALRYVNLLLDGYASNADARWLVDWHDIWVLILHNPDGHHIVEGGTPSPYLHRKNADRDDGCTVWPPSPSNHFGVDLNRNFPYKWNYCGGCSSGQPCDQTYRGPAENSEEETQAVVAKIRQLIPDQRGPGDDDAAPLTTMGVYLDLHSYGRYNVYPYGWSTTRQAPNHNDLDNIAQHMRATNAFPAGNNYTSCQAGPCFYPTDGASDDWEYGELGAPSYTTEVGTSFTPAYSQVEPIWNENRGMLLYLAKIARTPYLLTRGPDTVSPATSPMTVTQGTPVDLTATINYGWTGNRYVQNVGGAEYYVGTPPWAGGPPVAMQAVDGAFDEQTEPVQAAIDTSTIPPGTYVIYVRGRGVNDYGGLGSWGAFTATWLTVTSGGSTPTSTAVPPTSTTTVPPPTSPPATETSAPATGTAASTLVPSTATVIGSTATAIGATNTAVASSTATPTVCTITFTDVPPTDPFYTFVRCLACQGVLSGYADGTFRPYSSITRGQIAKVVSNAAGFYEPVTGQRYEDVLPTNTFYEFIERLSGRGHMGGYPCGGAGSEPCVPPENRPYFRPGNTATRAQLSKIVSSAAGFNDEPGPQLYEDVPPDHPFFVWIQRLGNRGIIGGYPCGGTGEPCVPPENRPYFRPYNDVTRGQASRIVASVFIPDCR